MAKIFWFQRKSDKEYIPIDGEEAAALLMKHKEFDKRFKYVGVSDGVTFNNAIIMIPKLNEKEKAKALESGKHSKKNVTAYEKAFAAELAVAKKNGKKYTPRFISNIDMNGSLQRAGINSGSSKLFR